MMKNQTTTLSNDEIVRLAPAAGATAPHAMVSEKYSFVPTIQAVDLLRSVGWLPIDARQSRARNSDRNGYQKHIIRFIQGGILRDEERVDMVLTNSHDRGCAFQLTASVWRKICGNGLMVSSDLYNFSHRHIGFDGQAFMDSAYKIAESAGEIASQVDDLKIIELEPDEKGVYAAAAHRLVYDDIDNAPITPSQLLQERRYDDKGNDLWSVANKIQENLIRGGLKGSKRGVNGRIRKVTTRPVRSIDRDIRLNKALWVLTEEMAKLKKS